MNIVECTDVNKTYQQGQVQIVALKDVSFCIETGAFVALAGPSGSGKTTLLNLIGGLDSADSGDITVDGNPFGQMSQSQLAKLRLYKVGFVFQAYNLIPVLSAAENVEFVMLLQGIPVSERKQRARAILDEVGLGENMIADQPNYPVASNSGWRWPEPLCPIRRLCWQMNPPPIWIRKPEKVFWKS